MWDPFEEDFPENAKNSESSKEGGDEQQTAEKEKCSTAKELDGGDTKTEQDSMDLEELLEQATEQDSKETASSAGRTDKPIETVESAGGGLKTENSTEKE